MKHTALITGASGGIGKELALLFAEQGENLVLVARRENELLTVKQEIEQKYRVSVHLIIKDLCLPGSCQEVFEETQTAGLKVDYLVNNAGFGSYGLFHEQDWHINERMIDLNIKALAELTRYYLPGMVNRGLGKVLNIASTAGWVPGPLAAVYFASKSFVVSFSLALAEEVRGTGVTVTVLCPGPVETGFMNSSNWQGTNLFEKQRIAKPAYVAKIGFRAMLKGKLMAFDRKLYQWSMTRIIPLAPKWMVLRITKKLLEKSGSV